MKNIILVLLVATLFFNCRSVAFIKCTYTYQFVSIDTNKEDESFNTEISVFKNKSCAIYSLPAVYLFADKDSVYKKYLLTNSKNEYGYVFDTFAVKRWKYVHIDSFLLNYASFIFHKFTLKGLDSISVKRTSINSDLFTISINVNDKSDMDSVYLTFDSKLKNNKNSISPYFDSMYNSKLVEWKLILYNHNDLNGNDDKSRRVVSLKMQLESNVKDPVVSMLFDRFHQNDTMNTPASPILEGRGIKMHVLGIRKEYSRDDPSFLIIEMIAEKFKVSFNNEISTFNSLMELDQYIEKHENIIDVSKVILDLRKAKNDSIMPEMNVILKKYKMYKVIYYEVNASPTEMF